MMSEIRETHRHRHDIPIPFGLKVLVLGTVLMFVAFVFLVVYLDRAEVEAGDRAAQRRAMSKPGAEADELSACTKAGLKTPYWDVGQAFFYCADENGRLFRLIPPVCNTHDLAACEKVEGH